MSAITTFFAAIKSGTVQEDAVCFDFGSAITKVTCRNELVFCEPTCLAVHTQTQAVVAAGSAALKLLGKTPASIEIVFPIQNGAPAHSAHLEAFITTILEKTHSKNSGWLHRLIFGENARVVSHATLSPAKKTLLAKVAKNAGINNMVFIPHARALASKKSTKEQYFLDIGAQTTQLSIGSLQEVIASQAFLWGGAAVTELFQEYLRVRHGCVVSWHTAEQAKIDFSVATSPKHKQMILGKDILTQASKTVLVQAGEFQQHYSPYILELLDWLENTLATLPSQVAVGLLQSGLVLTGSASQLYGLSQAISDRFSCPVLLSKQPQLDSVLGL